MFGLKIKLSHKRENLYVCNQYYNNKQLYTELQMCFDKNNCSNSNNNNKMTSNFIHINKIVK